MAMTLAHILLTLLAVAMTTTAAPLATGEEVAMAANSDANTVDRAKRAKEEIVFGNQQNSAMLGATKKSVEPQELLLSRQDDEVAPPPQQQLPSDEQNNEDLTGSMHANEEQPVEGLQQVEGEKEKEGEEAEEPQDQKEPNQSDSDSAEPQSFIEEPATAPEQPYSEESQEPETAESAAAEQEPDSAEPEGEVEVVQPVPVEGGETGEDDQDPQQMVNNELSLIPAEEGGVHPEPDEKAEEEQQQENADEQDAQPPTINELPDVDNGQNSDSEQALQILSQAQDINTDDVENLLKELHEDNNVQTEQSESDEEGKTDDGDTGDEDSAEKELMQATNEIADGNVDAGEYTQSLLKYILSHGDEYGRIPSNNDYMFPAADPYYLQRRRRSPASLRRGLPHIHRRRSSSSGGKQLARSKRTKRDLFDDDLYYNAVPQYDPRVEEAEEEEKEEEKEAELQELIAYLIALYPALYDNEQKNNQFPAYLWQGSNYFPEEEEEAEEGEEPYWEEPSAYEEEWEPDLPSPAWEPSFYPEEEVEEEEAEPNFYPVLAKRQMLSMVPGQRRKRYFYPFAREPYTHWGAFVPAQEKRDYYDDAYKRLKELALVMAESRQPSYNLDALDDYRKK